MFKNLTIRQISLYISFSIWLCYFVLLLSYVFFTNSQVNWLSLILVSFISFICGYVLVRFLFETYIFRKIKLIYKIISDSKDSLKEAPSLESNQTTIEDVNDIVEEWADEKQKEITSLRSLEDYRRKYVGDISHELKTPLFSIEGYLHTLLEGGLHDQNINEKYLSRAMVNVERLQSIVDDLEMINRLESQLGEFKFQPFNLKTLVEEVFSDLELMAAEMKIELIFKPSASKSFKVNGDKENIRKVFINLINNSIKYGKEQGRTKVSFYDMEDLVLVEISDNGIGIAEDDLKHVFDRFYRADKSRSNHIPGTGLGLSIVKHIMEAHQQSINVRSTIEKGSTFGFTLKKVS